MSRRLVTHRARCAHTGCVEAAHYEYGSLREREAHAKTLREHPWRCTRHTAPDEVLSDTNTERTTILIATPGDGYSADTLFWCEEGSERNGSGFTHGPGFKAYAADFAPGTRMEVTARVLPPATP